MWKHLLYQKKEDENEEDNDDDEEEENEEQWQQVGYFKPHPTLIKITCRLKPQMVFNTWQLIMTTK